MLVMHMGGAPSRVPAEATAVGIRGAQFGVVTQGAWEKPEDDARADRLGAQHLRGRARLRLGRAYVNFLTDDESARDRRRLRAGALRAAAPDQGKIRSGQPVQRQPQHPAALVLYGCVPPTSEGGHVESHLRSRVAPFPADRAGAAGVAAETVTIGGRPLASIEARCSAHAGTS